MSALTPAQLELLDGVLVGVLATQSPSGRPRQSVVYYAREGDRLLITTIAERQKCRDVERTGWASLCVVGRDPPFPSAAFSGSAEILREGIAGATAAVMQRIMGLDEPPEAQTDEALAAVGRVILAIAIERVSAATHLAEG